MSFRLVLDEDTNLSLASALRKAEYEVTHIQEVDRKGKSDKEQLEYATSQFAAILTHNIADFILPHEEYVKLNLVHYGIIVAKRQSFSSLYHKIKYLMENETTESLKDYLKYL